MSLFLSKIIVMLHSSPVESLSHKSHNFQAIMATRLENIS